MTNEGSMKVDVAKLREMASEMSKVYKSYSTCLSQATKENERLKSTWTGQAAEAFYAGFAPLSNKCNDYMMTLDNTIRVLYEIADTYEASEASIESAAEKLPSLPTNTML